MTDETTHQLRTWQSQFGNDYIGRNLATDSMLRSRVQMWSRILECTTGAPPESLLEVGSNIGINLRALRAITPAKFYAVEPNKTALDTLIADKVVPQDQTFHGYGSKIPLPDASVDLVYTSGVLIHVPPEQLDATISEMRRVAKRYVVCVEYFNDKPVMIPYHGQDNLLFKRDFGGLWMDKFQELRLLDYGFFWKRITGLDNLTWWLWTIDPA